MKLKEIPWYNRPGTRLKRKGVTSLSDAELLAIVFGRGDLQENAIDQANRILHKQNFTTLARLSYPEMNQTTQDHVKAMKMQAMFEIFKRTNKLRDKGFSITMHNAADVFRCYREEFRNQTKKYYYALFLNKEKKIIHEELLAIGSLNASLHHPRTLFQLAQKMGCTSLFLLHNQPQKKPSPTPEDERITHLLLEAGTLMKIPLHDHVIIGTDQYYSFKEEKKMAKKTMKK